MNHLPDSESLQQARELSIYDSSGQKVKFGAVLSPKGKTIVVFIRHFFCGSCQAYATNLAGVVSDEALAKAEVSLLLIGCGDYELIKDYAETTGFRAPIYADTSRSLFHHFGLIANLQKTPANEPKKSYIANLSMLSNIVQSLWRGPIAHPLHIGKQGNISQLGGDFIFGPDGQCLFASRMRHTEDHVEVAELMQHAGVDVRNA